MLIFGLEINIEFFFYLKDYTKSETLETAINCGVYGSQVGEKQTRFSHFPNVLQLHLKRFKSHQIFDQRTKKMTKVTVKLDSR